jgi:hypothetical protein
MVSYVSAVGADALLTIPVGSWGNGNYLPAGMPLNETFVIGAKVGAGYLAEPSAYAAYLGAVVNHARAAGESVRYWTIGNEMPLMNSSVVEAYIQLFNLAATLIHHSFPNALVGSDVMTNKQYLPTFARDTRGVGFLSFHFYAANQVCVVAGQYCPPSGSANEPTNPQIWVNDTNFSLQHFTPPPQAVAEWYAQTGEHLPDFNAEVNLDSGGGFATALNGTDPRQQELFAAPWLVATLINGESENVRYLDYFTLYGPSTVPATVSGPYGGWGFGMSAMGANSNVTLFSPYWALHMWSSYLPGGSPGLLTNSSDPYLVQAQAVRTPSGIGIALASAANATVHVTVRVVGAHFRPVNGTVFDATTYAVPPGTNGGNISLLRDGVTGLALNSSRTEANVTITGGGISMIAEAPYRAASGSGGNHSSPNGSGNGSGSSGGSGNGTSPGPGPSPGQPGTGPNRPYAIGRGPASGLSQPSFPSSLPGLLGVFGRHARDLVVLGAVAAGWSGALLLGFVASRGGPPNPPYSPLRPRTRRH